MLQIQTTEWLYTQDYLKKDINLKLFYRLVYSASGPTSIYIEILTDNIQNNKKASTIIENNPQIRSREHSILTPLYIAC